MNTPLYVSTLRQLFSQPVRTGALIGATILPLLQIAVDPDPHLATTMGAMWIAVIASAGIIGMEITSGSVALFFTRPLTRAAYLASRWSAAATISLALMFAGLAGEVAMLTARDGEMTRTAFALALADRFFIVTGTVSVMVCFSTLASSLGDVVIWLSIQIVAFSLGAVPMASFHDAADLLRRIATPMLDVHRVLASSRVPWSEVSGYAGTVLMAAAIATFVMNRKELSYASE